MKKPIIAIVIILLVLLGVWFFYSKSKKTEPSSMMKPTVAQTEQKGLFTSIQDALSKSLTLQCSFTDEQGKQTTSYIKGGAVRTDFEGTKPDDKGSVIMKDSKMWFWNDTKKTGMMMAFNMNDMMQKAKEMAPSVSPSAQANQSTQGQNVMSALEKYKKSCKPSVVSDNLFVPPTDVTFTDYSQMMNDVKKMTPSGTPGAMNQQQIQQMMQKYAPKQ